MRLKLTAAVCVLGIAAILLPDMPAEAQTTTVVRSKQRTVVTPRKARTRVVVRPRSYLDAGTEVLPGERKFTDYAIPPNYRVLANTAPRNAARYPLLGPFEWTGRQQSPWPW
jgi:hypothetical protein